MSPHGDSNVRKLNELSPPITTVYVRKICQLKAFFSKVIKLKPLGLFTNCTILDGNVYL